MVIIRNAKNFGILIRKARKQGKLTQRELAAAANLGVRFVRELEQGKPSCQLDKALHAAFMLGIKFEATLPPLDDE